MDKSIVVNEIIEKIQLDASQAQNEEQRDDILGELEFFEELDLSPNTHTAQLGSLVTLETNGVRARYFLSPTKTANFIKVKDNVILVLSAFSPLGDAILSQAVGDEVVINSAKGDKSYKIIEVS